MDGALDDLLCCSICMEPFDTGLRAPKMLPCQHAFCLACLLSMVDQLGLLEDVLECPNCRRSVTIPGRKAECLPDSLHIKQLLDIRKHEEMLNLCGETIAEDLIKNEACVERLAKERRTPEERQEHVAKLKQRVDEEATAMVEKITARKEQLHEKLVRAMAEMERKQELQDQKMLSALRELKDLGENLQRKDKISLSEWDRYQELRDKSSLGNPCTDLDDATVGLSVEFGNAMNVESYGKVIVTASEMQTVTIGDYLAMLPDGKIAMIMSKGERDVLVLDLDSEDVRRFPVPVMKRLRTASDGRFICQREDCIWILTNAGVVERVIDVTCDSMDCDWNSDTIYTISLGNEADRRFQLRRYGIEGELMGETKIRFSGQPVRSAKIQLAVDGGNTFVLVGRTAYRLEGSVLVEIGGLASTQECVDGFTGRKGILFAEDGADNVMCLIDNAPRILNRNDADEEKVVSYATFVTHNVQIGENSLKVVRMLGTNTGNKDSESGSKTLYSLLLLLGVLAVVVAVGFQIYRGYYREIPIPTPTTPTLRHYMKDVMRGAIDQSKRPFKWLTKKISGKFLDPPQ